MKKIILPILLVAGLGGCAVWSAITGDKAETITVETVLAACDSYASALQLIDIADQVKPLTPTQVAAVNRVIVAVKKICPPDGAMPTNLLTGLAIVLQAVKDLPAAVKGS